MYVSFLGRRFKQCVVVVEVEGSEPDPLVADVGPGVDSAGLPLERPEAVPLSGPEISSVRVSS